MQTHTEWRPRPAISRLVRIAALSVPVVAAVAAGVATGRALPRPAGLGETMWIVAVVGVATIALVTVDRVARHALPLAWLYRLTVVFPDKAPSRLRVAFRSASIARLQRRAQAEGRAPATPADGIDDLVALAAALSTHDRRTRAHSERVRALTRVVGEQLRLSPAAVERLEWAAFLHDIGKLTVPPSILNKTGRPDAGEWSLLARHPDEGAHLAAPLTPWLGDWLRGVRDHHERWDGTGYPNRLAGPEISLAGRIVCVTDAFETMTAVRSYKRPMSATTARRELVACSGTHFDPHVVRAFLDVSLGRLWWILGPVSWLALVPLVGRLPRAAAAGVARHPGRVAGGLRAAGLALAAAGSIASLAIGHASPDRTALPVRPGTPPAVSTTVGAAPPAATPGSSLPAPAAPVTAPASDAAATVVSDARTASGAPGTPGAPPAPGPTTTAPAPGPSPPAATTPALVSVTVGPGVNVAVAGRPIVDLQPRPG
ncbi:MAG TPA: HD-GYP domain-containing protein [Acidimicrobiia bacterium]|nr:HD-GYP domain-containing protein [Acidimicrobiia bacterium]